MSESIKISSFCKERNKLVGSKNYLAWKKRTDLILKKNEAIGHVKVLIVEPPKEEAQALQDEDIKRRRNNLILYEGVKNNRLTQRVGKNNV